MPSEPRKIHCQTHGDNREAFVCGHLVRGSNLGFFVADDPTNPYPDAWCSGCERSRLENGGEWTEESEALLGIKLVCGECYREIRTRNLLKS